MATSRQPHRTRTGYLSQPWWRRWARRERRRSSGMDASKARMAWREGESDSSSQGNSGRHRCGVMGKPREKGVRKADAQSFPASPCCWGRNREKTPLRPQPCKNHRHLWGIAKPGGGKDTGKCGVPKTRKSLFFGSRFLQWAVVVGTILPVDRRAVARGQG